MGERIWRNTAEDGDRMRRRSAELLVHEQVPFYCFEQLVVRNKSIAEVVSAESGSPAPSVRISPDWYYQS